jgi:predicted transcriptional regulator of viral defense system
MHIGLVREREARVAKQGLELDPSSPPFSRRTRQSGGETGRPVYGFAAGMANQPRSTPRTLASWVDELQAGGSYSFTGAEVAQEFPRSSATNESALRRLKHRGRIVSPRRGFFVVVPLEYREAGAPPPTWWVADLMRFLGQRYYVGLLSAASMHGAGHQQPMAFQVVTDRTTRAAKAGRSRVEFHRSRALASTPVVEVQTETGSLVVATPEAVAFDLVRYVPAAGYWSNAATVLSELAERLQPAALVACADAFTVPDVQRLGFLLDFVGASASAAALAEQLHRLRVRDVLLAPGRRASRARPHPIWRVIKNVEVELDQ